ncbi:MAG TPA: PEP/pyruvate-binding domain-containing protein [Kiritimatiellia bacterium]|nr:PEP/pyruvate-binding domain-containing protein [Kiritimatiellia bacterium]HPA79110.1 PEP/pyruvate-binding domain-containing protein [Kiritimatiellia bacterium]HQQ05249.1 PEP/pyruvate-binding domain-containing protein [Kiritimatiellia bacterium]
MSTADASLTTGLPGLDAVLKGVLAGDNIVWQVDSIDEYQEVAAPYCEAAVRNGRRLIYFRFARHQPLVAAGPGVEVHELDPEEGFESFIEKIHGVIEESGPGAFYVFDCLSRLAVDWCSDQMLANFFMLTCPYLFNLETVAYFSLYRNYHTTHALGPIQNTTQLFLDTYRHKGVLYVRPVKVQHRYSPTMHMLHLRRGEEFLPVTASAVITEILSASKWSGLSSDTSAGFWETSFFQARELIKSGEYRPDIPEKGKDLFSQLVRMIVSRDERMRDLVARHLTLQDILDIRQRMIGTGLIGGKTVGMLLARMIVRKALPRFAERMEEHDSFFIGSDVFYSFLVRNGIWWVRQKQRDPEKYLENAEQARRLIITGEFPEYILRQFDEMLDYFGQSPFIVRSSSLLEDNYGNSFAGKYDSVFCANQGPRERRMQDFLAAVKAIYASSMSEKALQYRARRGMLDKDEQMALLVMRVSGASYGQYYFPQFAGVGFSFNPYAWHESIDPQAGVVRLVFGLGTRAVDRADDDYTRVVALNAPDRRPESNFDKMAQYAQRRVDCLDLEGNQLVSRPFHEVVAHAGDIPLDMFTTSDPPGSPGVLTFSRLLSKTPFVADMRELMQALESAYGCPVDIEFAANFTEKDKYKINLLQCRPLQVQGAGTVKVPRVHVTEQDRIIEARGAVVGHSRTGQIGRFIYVAPELYGKLPVADRYEVARIIGVLNLADAPGPVMLLGPGRWGTSTPSLGIPVSFSEINRVSVLCEIVAMHEHLVPDVSLGTHFLNELVETGMLYLALFPGQGVNFISRAFFESAPDRAPALVPGAARWPGLIRVVDVTDIRPPVRVNIIADAPNQKVICYMDRT